MICARVALVLVLILSTFVGSSGRRATKSEVRKITTDTEHFPDANTLDLDINPVTGQYFVTLNGKIWFQSADYFLHSDGKRYSSSDGTLKLSKIIPEKLSSHTHFGEYNETKMIWEATGDSDIIYETIFRRYLLLPQIIEFEQHFPKGLKATTIADQNFPTTGFPTVVLQNLQEEPDMKYLHIKGTMGGASHLKYDYPRFFSTGYDSGPLIFYSLRLEAILLSSLSEFTSASVGYDNSTSSVRVRVPDLAPNSVGGVISYGVQGMCKEIPPGFSYKTLFQANSRGINSLMNEWGQFMRRYYGRKPPTIDSSPMLKYLGYTTTGYYYYHPIEGNGTHGDYEKTVLTVQKMAVKNKIPYRYYLFDSWWYNLKEHRGVYLWEDDAEYLKHRIPHGMKALHDSLDTPVMAHLGHWVGESPYLSDPDNGFLWRAATESEVKKGKWNTSKLVEDISSTFGGEKKNPLKSQNSRKRMASQLNHLAMPTSEKFFDKLFGQARGWGLHTVKQDHMFEQVEGLADLVLVDTTTVAKWLDAEAASAKRYGITLEYCMHYPAFLLHSLRNPAVVMGRAGADYLPHLAKRSWNTLITHLLYFGLGLYPDTDTALTGKYLVPDTSRYFPNYTEPDPELHLLSAVLSTGSVAPSDRAGAEDRELIMRSCTDDGILLKPDRPALNLDIVWIQVSVSMYQVLASTHSTISGRTWHYLLVRMWDKYVKLKPFHLRGELDSVDERYVAYPMPLSTGRFQAKPFFFSNDEPIALKSEKNGTSLPGNGVQYYIICPILSDGWVFLGETSKFVPAAKQRFSKVQVASGALEVELSGKPDEEISVSFIRNLEKNVDLKVETEKIIIPQYGRKAKLIIGSSKTTVEVESSPKIKIDHEERNEAVHHHIIEKEENGVIDRTLEVDHQKSTEVIAETVMKQNDSVMWLLTGLLALSTFIFLFSRFRAPIRRYFSTLLTPRDL